MGKVNSLGRKNRAINAQLEAILEGSSLSEAKRTVEGTTLISSTIDAVICFQQKKELLYRAREKMLYIHISVLLSRNT